MESKYSKKKIAYNSEYTKNNYKQFKVNIKNAELEDLELLLDKNGLTKALFVRIAINYLEKGLIKMKRCEEIKDYLRGKEIEIEPEERDDFSLGNYPAQSEEDSITLDDGYLFYIINKEDTKCYISLNRRTDPNDVNDEHLEDGYFDGYFNYETLSKLLKLVK